MGIEDNGDTQKQAERSEDVQNLEFSGLMKPTVNDENLGRDESENIKENIMENDIGRKLEITRRRNPAESDMRESLALSKLINSNLQGGDDQEGGRTRRKGAESWRRQTEGGRGLVDDTVETLISRAGTSASSADGITGQTVKGDKGRAGHHCGYKYYACTVLTSVFKLMLRMETLVQILITACI